jgi:hypothetical protein
MAKNDSLSSDIDLIKELESLRIKQKLLVESLSKKSGEHENILLSHIDAKLEFLVKIFQDTSTPAPVQNESEKVDENGKEIVGETFESRLFERLESIENSMIARFDELDEKILKLKASQKKEQSKLPSQTSNSDKLPPIPTFNEDIKVKTDDSKTTSESTVKSSEKTLDNTLENSSEEIIEKKKKWF